MRLNGKRSRAKGSNVFIVCSAGHRLHNTCVVLCNPYGVG